MPWIPYRLTNWIRTGTVEGTYNSLIVHHDKDETLLDHLNTCQPTPRVRTDGGGRVALLYLDAAIKTPIDCNKQISSKKNMSSAVKSNVA